MTKSTITRERLEWLSQISCRDDIEDIGGDEIRELASIALAVMDSEPVAYTDERNLGYIDRGRETAYLWGKQNSEASDVALYRHAQPALVVPDEIKHRIGGLDWGWEGEFNRGWNACRAAMLQAEPVCTCPSGDGSLRWPCPVHPGNSPAIPDCWCRTCRPVVLNDMRFVVCPDCGNKRCPRANDHRNACTGSNEPGQEGSAYPDTPQEVKGE